MATWNETTVEILELLEEGPKTVEAIAQALGCSRSNVTTPILKLLRTGRVDRELDEKGEVVLKNLARGRQVRRPNKVYVYHITDSGLERLKDIRKDFKGR